jgi:6-phosphogluconolactonase
MPGNEPSFEMATFANPDALARAAAGAWLDEIAAAHQAGQRHCVALSGGRIAQRFFSATVEQANARAVPFAGVHFFWADERCVPPADPESNFRLAHELLLTPLRIPERQIHRLRGEEVPATAAEMAELELREWVPAADGGWPMLDLVLLGLGEDGHVASLFPDAGEVFVDNPASFLAIQNSPKPPPRRITLSYGAIIAARQVWTLVSGAGKAAALSESLRLAGRTPLARVIAGRCGAVKIFSDLVGI